jgi:hypothetical protein
VNYRDVLRTLLANTVFVSPSHQREVLFGFLVVLLDDLATQQILEMRNFLISDFPASEDVTEVCEIIDGHLALREMVSQ